jgi:SAM-dependent methyltransferase
MIFVNGRIHESASNPLGHASPDRYRPGSWPHALLQRMAYWLRRSHRHNHVLDLGCGEGALLQAAGLRGIGVDLNPERLALAVEKGLRVVRADGGSLPFADDTFDVVVCMEVLEHVPRIEPVISEVARVLRPGGRWIISVPSVTLRSWYEMRKDHRPYYCDADEHYREFTPVAIPWFEHRFYRVSLFEAQLKAHGLHLQNKDGVRYLFPQWLSRMPAVQRFVESPRADRFWAHMPGVRRFPYWLIYVLEKSVD